MHVAVIPSLDEIKVEELFHKTVILLDILRTSSTIITALAKEDINIITADTVGQAKILKNQHPSYLLAGERFYKKIPGFNVSNSPLEMYSTDLQYNNIILSTMNGTRAIQKAQKGDNVLIGGFLNGNYCVTKAISFKKDIVMLCVGERNEFSLEDGLAAGFFIDLIKKYTNDDLYINDFGIAMYGAYKYNESHLTSLIKTTKTAKKLIQLGLQDDIEFSCQTNIFDVCPYLSEEQIIKKL